MTHHSVEVQLDISELPQLIEDLRNADPADLASGASCLAHGLAAIVAKQITNGRPTTPEAFLAYLLARAVIAPEHRDTDPVQIVCRCDDTASVPGRMKEFARKITSPPARDLTPGPSIGNYL